jgi:hypothetical protein
MWAPTLGRVGSPLRREDAAFRRRIVGLDCPNRRARRRQRAWRRNNVLGEDRSIAAFVAPVQLSCWIGQPNSSGNPPELSNAGWDPYGLGDTSHNWWNVAFPCALSATISRIASCSASCGRAPASPLRNRRRPARSAGLARERCVACFCSTIAGKGQAGEAEPLKPTNARRCVNLTG